MKIISVTRILDENGRVVIPEEAQKSMNLDENIIFKIDKENQILYFSRKESGGQGIQARLDNGSRLAIPSDYLQQLNWEAGMEIGLHAEGEIGILQKTAPSCLICGSNHNLLKIKSTLVCDDCIQTGNEAVVKKWSEILMKVYREYKTFCDGAVKSIDTENVHKARTKGRRLRTLLQFIGVAKNHPLYRRLKNAHDALGKVREEDVFIEAFQKETENGSNESVYSAFSKSAKLKRDRQREKLKKKLPDIIDDHFSSLFHSFLKKELKDYILTLDIQSELKKHEEDYHKRVGNYHEVISDKGKATPKGIDALHEVRKKAKKLRYIYSYLDKLNSKDYKSKSKPYKRIQKKFGDIIDLRDWLEETGHLKVESKDGSVEKLRKRLKKRQKQLLEKVEI
ncbi:CHAD domain-containing protein [Bacillus salacetis]|uniref:CHAD domain-containing protein n=1 Tax=Bacillus salacetis TaxID=2315464 RepID=A0A3A1R1A5_9BACI|nr:CHAD domain-containing protein [Bacillus salacetis]RIW34717.1 CHAD domain-containing protein [Bacillus salacetis]